MTRQPGPFPWEDQGDTADTAGETAGVDSGGTENAGSTAGEDSGAAETAGDTAGVDSGRDLGVTETAGGTAGEPVAEARAPQQHRPLVRKEYYSISEVADLVGLPAHVLRYWESQFSVLNPSKNRSGNRVYQRKEIRLILLVKQLLYDEKYTVEGAKQRLDQLRRGGGLQEATAGALDGQLIQTLRAELAAVSELLAPEEA